MPLRFAYTRPDGGVSIVIAAPKEAVEKVLGPLTDREYKAHVIGRSIPRDATDVMELAEEWMPPENDRTFREAWRVAAGAVGVDMPIARDLDRDRLRLARAPVFAELDIAYQRAHEEAGDTADIVAKKNVLRDIPAHPSIEAASTPEELKAATAALMVQIEGLHG